MKGRRFVNEPLGAIADRRHHLLGQNLHLVEGEAVGHAGPMDRRDEVVDAEASLQIDKPIGDFGR